jgi:DNA-binding MarR family transcriptional regulator
MENNVRNDAKKGEPMEVTDSVLQEFRRGIRTLEREIGNQLRADTSCCGVTVSQCHMILELEERGPSSLVDLEESLQTDRSILSRVAESLVRAGYAVREPGKEDRRYVSLALTEAGREKARFINETCNRYSRELFSRIPRERRGRIVRAVPELAGAMAAVRKSPGWNSPDLTCPCGGDDER